MKKLIFFGFILLGIIITGTASSFLNTGDVKREIRLKGSLYEGSARSVLPDPIQATVSSLSLDVVFFYNVGIIDVEIYSESGNIVYSESVDTQTQEYLSIDVSDWDSGTYHIRFVNLTGQYMYGAFETE